MQFARAEPTKDRPWPPRMLHEVAWSAARGQRGIATSTVAPGTRIAVGAPEWRQRARGARRRRRSRRKDVPSLRIAVRSKATTSRSADASPAPRPHRTRRRSPRRSARRRRKLRVGEERDRVVKAAGGHHAAVLDDPIGAVGARAVPRLTPSAPTVRRLGEGRYCDRLWAVSRKSSSSGTSPVAR